jgi:hypothetical protein
MTGHERFIVDEKGNRVSVVLDIAEYEKLLEELEELADVRAYDEAKASGERPIPWKQAREEIEREKE